MTRYYHLITEQINRGTLIDTPAGVIPSTSSRTIEALQLLELSPRSITEIPDPPERKKSFITQDVLLTQSRRSSAARSNQSDNITRWEIISKFSLHFFGDYHYSTWICSRNCTVIECCSTTIWVQEYTASAMSLVVHCYEPCSTLRIICALQALMWLRNEKADEWITTF